MKLSKGKFKANIRNIFRRLRSMILRNSDPRGARRGPITRISSNQTGPNI